MEVYRFIINEDDEVYDVEYIINREARYGVKYYGDFEIISVNGIPWEKCENQKKLIVKFHYKIREIDGPAISY